MTTQELQSTSHINLRHNLRHEYEYVIDTRYPFRQGYKDAREFIPYEPMKYSDPTEQAEYHAGFTVGRQPLAIPAA